MSDEKPVDAQKKKRQAAAAQALAHYDDAKFTDTKTSLDALAKDITAEKDLIALEHNKVVTNFSSTPRSETTVRETLKNLQLIRERAVEHRAGRSSATTVVQTDGTTTGNQVQPPVDPVTAAIASTPTTTDTTSTATSATTSTATSPDAIDPEIAGDPQLSTMLFNEAVLCCTLGQFRSALVRLDALFQNIMLLDDWLAVRTCYLLLDIYIHVHRGLEADSTSLQHLATCSTKVLEALEQRTNPNDDETRGGSGGDGDGGDVEPSSLKSIPDLKFHLRLYRAKLQLVTSNVKNAKKEIKAALDIYNKDIKHDKTGTSMVAKIVTGAPALYLKANLEYVRENFKKSVKLLNAALSNKSMHQATYMNNMGCINFQSQRYAVASLYFSRALTSIEDDVTGIPSIHRAEVLYNIGLQMLMCDKDMDTAFQCFHRAALELHMRPRVWMRLAECCVAEHEKRLRSMREKRMESGSNPPTLSSSTQHTSTFQNDMVAAIIHGRRVMLPTGAPGSGGIPTGLVTSEEASMSMGYAIMCLRNVLYLTTKEGGGEESEGRGGGGGGESGKKSSGKKSYVVGGSGESKTKEESKTEDVVVRHAALVSLSYCSLCQSNSILALEYATRLLDDSEPSSDTHKYLSHTYAAEALCTMNRCAEALAHMTAAMAVSEEQQQNKRINEAKVGGSVSIAYAPTSPEARAALYVNVASIRLQQNELEMAEKSLRQALTLAPASPDALRGLIYLRLRQGQPQDAMQMLQERRPSTV